MVPDAVLLGIDCARGRHAVRGRYVRIPAYETIGEVTTVIAHVRIDSERGQYEPVPARSVCAVDIRAHAAGTTSILDQS